MQYNFTGLTIISCCDESKYASQLFSEEIEQRTGAVPSVLSENDSNISPAVIFVHDDKTLSRDSYKLDLYNSRLTVTANGIRGFIYGYSLFLRKTEYRNNTVMLIKDISGTYSPEKRIRGHQLGYRGTPNSYDAWDYDMYFRYYRDLMYFGCNTVEHIPYENGKSEKNKLMKYDEEEFLIEASKLADMIDIDVSIWYPNSENTTEDSLAAREKVFGKTSRINVVFPPGGDPGHLDPDELMERCARQREILKKYHPDAEMWPSAQQPHGKPFWGQDFIDEMKKMPEFIDGVITGPNRAFPLDELRRKLPSKYPIRLYPDITHNVRCEYPVHFNRDDWHYALCTALSRESVNPRPSEYRLIHKLTERYVVGSVSYSEGINDDLNKAVWSALDFASDVNLREIVCDYARLFFVGCDTQTVADGLFGFEKNWEGAPDENPSIENTYSLWLTLGKEKPELYENWRYVLYLFRACCDVFVRRKLIFENRLIEEFSICIRNNDICSAKFLLENEFPKDIIDVRERIEYCAKLLFELIGMQLDIERYGAQGWERGATLETIDLPITDRQWLQNKINSLSEKDDKETAAYMKRLIDRNKVLSDEYYFSFALNGLEQTGTSQTPDFYMDFQGDRPNVNNGSLPVCMFKLYDHFNFSFKSGGFLENTDYALIITYRNSPAPISLRHNVSINGNTIYEGKQFGGKRCETFERDFLPDGYTAVLYDIPKEYIVNGCIELNISEPLLGFCISEFRIIRKQNTEEYL